MPSTLNTNSARPFAVFDIDGTLIRWQLYHAVADLLLKADTNTELYDSIRQARKKWKQRSHATSFREYENAVVDAYESILKTLSVEEFNQAVDAVIDEHKDQVYTFTRDLIAELKEQGYFLLAISGSQTELIKKIADYYDFDDFVGTDYTQDSGRFTGQKIHGAAQKDAALKEFIQKHNLTQAGSYAVGDSESDIPMLAIVENPIAFNPTKALLETAQKQSWQVVVERKNVIYKLEKHNDSYLLA